MIIFTLMDVLTKYLAEMKIQSGVTVPVIPAWLSWKVIHNAGASFGLFSGHRSLIIAVSLLAILFVYYLYRKTETKDFVVKFSFAFILSGAIGNLIDRVVFGNVTDFIQFRWWPAIFNVADVEIRTGAVLLLMLLMVKRFSVK